MKYRRMIINIIYTLLFDIAEKDFNIIPIFSLYYTISGYVLHLYYKKIHTHWLFILNLDFQDIFTVTVHLKYNLVIIPCIYLKHITSKWLTNASKSLFYTLLHSSNILVCRKISFLSLWCFITDRFMLAWRTTFLGSCSSGLLLCYFPGPTITYFQHHCAFP